MRKNSWGKYVSAINTDNSSKHLERNGKSFQIWYQHCKYGKCVRIHVNLSTSENIVRINFLRSY